ncbi:MAG TPA: AAA family ATPase, partial [Thermoanaerobaculia bacterium]
MLKVKRLEISGFKSFVDPVKVDFAGGVTAIVGPNGCGKSNLSEAMTWVLGEQSAKSLRGGTMEDVIFNGAEHRKPLGMAECTLTLETDSSFPGSDGGWMTIGRRVFRGGESQYRLNGRVVRLKEIRDILMDTGLGIRAYSVIEQGKIGMILSGKPQERRKLIEEAAGITRYKARKSVAEVKLQEATANLLRLDDVISEVERALRSLKRQAGAARRYQEKEVEYRELLEKVLAGRWAALSARLHELRSKIEEATTREAGLAADLHRDEAALAQGRQRLDELARAMAERH